MAQYTVQAPDGKTITLEGPAGASQDEVIAQAQKLYKPQATGPYVGGEKPYPVQPQQQSSSIMDRVKALYEVPATVATSAVAPFLGVGKGIVQNIRQGTNERVDRPELAQEFVYEPTSPVSQDILESMGKTFESAKIPAYVPGAGQLGRAVSATKGTLPTNLPPLPSYAQVQQQVQKAPNAIAGLLRQKEQSALSGVGSAEVPIANQRVAMAKSLREPIDLTKGQALRDLGQQQFEAEMIKTYPSDVGEPLIKAKLNQNDKILKNFDLYVDSTGAEKAGELNLRAVGKVVDKALVDSAKKAWDKTNKAYTAAREAGEMQAPVNYQPLQQYINTFAERPTLKGDLAKIISIVEDEIKINDPKKTGLMTINQLEDIYELINKSYDPETSSATYAVQMKKLINDAMEGQGGELYQNARKLRTKYAKEFENVAYVDKLLRKKPGTSDRAVAFEDVFDHAILKGSLDDVRAVAQALKKSGPEGEQAWKELQGQTIEQLKSAVTKSVKRDQNGNPIVSPAQFNSFVRELDQDGKLDYIFGKKGAQEIRDLRDTALTVYSPVEGINTSNTSSAFIQALDRISKSAVGKVPGVKAVTEYGTKKILEKQVEKSLNFDPNAAAKELRKGK